MEQIVVHVKHGKETEQMGFAEDTRHDNGS